MKFYGDGGIQSWYITRTALESILRLQLHRDLTPEQQWDLDAFLEKMCPREVDPGERQVVESAKSAGNPLLRDILKNG